MDLVVLLTPPIEFKLLTNSVKDGVIEACWVTVSKYSTPSLLRISSSSLVTPSALFLRFPFPISLSSVLTLLSHQHLPALHKFVIPDYLESAFLKYLSKAPSIVCSESGS